jgi:hypothetical protein
MYEENGGLNRLIGKKITEIHISDDRRVFTAADGELIGFDVEGDCCSHSYFYDFHGVRKLLDNGPVVKVGPIELAEPDQTGHECLQAYGFELVTESPKWGEQTSVLSFRNDSNGYYGGWMQAASTDQIDELKIITDDVVDVGAL